MDDVENLYAEFLKNNENSAISEVEFNKSKCAEALSKMIP